MRLLTTRDAWRGLGGFGHLAQYNAIQAGPGPANWQDVMNRFASFKFSQSKYVKKRPAGKQLARPLDKAERGERRDRGTAQGNAHDHTRQHIAQKVHAKHDARYRNA